MDKVKESITIEACGTFGAIGKADAYLEERGYLVGPMCMDMPIGFVPKDNENDTVVNIKWKNLSKEDIKELHGVIKPMPEFREGGCVIEFWK
jgi:hypothetical protein